MHSLEVAVTALLFYGNSMDGYDLFKKLGIGAKFDFNRFRKDAKKLHLIKPTTLPEEKFGVTQRGTDTGKDNGNDPNGNSLVPSLNDSTSGKRRREKSVSDDEHSHEEEKPCDDVYLLGNMKLKNSLKDGEVNKNLQKRNKKKKQKLDKSEKELQAEHRQEQINQFRNKHRIHVYGTDVPDPLQTFDELYKLYNLNRLLSNNVNVLRFEMPTPIQMQAIPVMLHRREILACAPTGSGKTLAFILPILHHLQCPQNKGFRAVVLSPTRELAAQTHREFQRIAEGTGFRIHLMEKVNIINNKYGKKAGRKFDILVTTPKRLVYLLKQDPPQISLDSVEWLIVDESDKLFEDGKTGFRDQIAIIYQSCSGKNIRRALFSATFTYEVEEWCKLNLDNLIQVYVGAKNAATESVNQELIFVGSEIGKLVAIRDMVKRGIEPPVLIFLQSKERAKELFHELIYDGINVDVIHADRTQLQRDNIVKQFRTGNIWFLICTELMGRGIDFKGVSLVVNYDFPNSAISYIHRIGRTGRAGHRGKAVTFFTEDDVVNLRSIATVMRQAGCPVPDYMLKLKKLDRHKKRKLARSALRRKSIRTVPRTEILKAHKRHRRLKQDKLLHSRVSKEHSSER
ncbi:hypothetical protein LSH36_2g03000 [Paralvinella palmiformis]|uniref:ATP-dependent RNA helicase n=1 Tax=Paralvinella palmiformis TaxID=53620 RepID=A0AAD9KF85_9ANNE|nr:hypothetical protein LSH36_2g03000 [Paralvinella palmiformis]